MPALLPQFSSSDYAAIIPRMPAMQLMVEKSNARIGRTGDHQAVRLLVHRIGLAQQYRQSCRTNWIDSLYFRSIPHHSFRDRFFNQIVTSVTRHKCLVKNLRQITRFHPGAAHLNRNEQAFVFIDFMRDQPVNKGGILARLLLLSQLESPPLKFTSSAPIFFNNGD